MPELSTPLKNLEKRSSDVADDKTGSKLNGSRNAVVAAVVSAILGSTGGPYLLVKFFDVNPYRQDAYTATQAKAQQRENELRFASLERHIRDHPDVELRAAIIDLKTATAEVRAEVKQVVRNQDRILDRLDGK